MVPSVSVGSLIAVPLMDVFKACGVCLLCLLEAFGESNRFCVFDAFGEVDVADAELDVIVCTGVRTFCLATR